MERVRLFSKTATPKRYKLFSEMVDDTILPKEVRTVKCIDCGYVIDTEADSKSLYCPNCGGTRFETISTRRQFSENPNNSRDRVCLFSTPEEVEKDFQKTFSETSDGLELKLKEFSGKSLTHREFQKEFGRYITESELSERGFGEVSDDKVKISSDAFLMSRLFSSIKISITKSLEFDPSVMNCENKRDIIENLGVSRNFPTKVITLLKEAHRIPVKEDNDAWIKDSGIGNDLKLEFGCIGRPMPIPELKTIVNERYPDAPENILDLLRGKGIIAVEGDHVKFI